MEESCLKPKKQKSKIIFLTKLLVCFLSLFFTVSYVYAADPHLELSPSTGTITTSGTDVQVKIDTGAQEAQSAKAVINFDATKLEVASIQADAFFDEVSHNIYNSTGQVIINTNFSSGSSVESKAGTGILATMTVQAKTASGSANMTFDCTSGDNTDSGINDSTATDIIDCASNVNGSYTLGSGGASPSPAVGGAGASPSALPAAGTIGPTINLLALAIGLILISIPLFLFV